MLKMVVSRVGFVGVTELPSVILLYEGFAPSPLMLMVKPEADVITPLRSKMHVPSRYSVIPGMVAVNTVSVDVESTSP